MIPDTDDGWSRWGDRVWTYPEALLSKELLCESRRQHFVKLQIVLIRMTKRKRIGSSHYTTPAVKTSSVIKIE